MIKKSEKIRNEYQDELLEIIEKLSGCIKTLKWSLMKKVPGGKYMDYAGWVGDPVEIKDTTKDFKPDLGYFAWVQINFDTEFCVKESRKKAGIILQEHKNKTIPAEYHNQITNVIKEQRWPYFYGSVAYRYSPKHPRGIFGNPEIPIAVVGGSEVE